MYVNLQKFDTFCLYYSIVMAMNIFRNSYAVFAYETVILHQFVISMLKGGRGGGGGEFASKIFFLLNYYWKM